MPLRLRRLVASFLPGLFLLGFNIGTGSVTAMAKAGAEHGMALLWALLLSCFVTWRLIALYGRFTLVTGRTAIAAFRHHIHPAWAVFLVVALTANVSGSVMGVMGIVAHMTAEASGRLLGVRFPPLGVAVAFTALVYALFWRGRTRVFEHALALLVAVMGGCFLANLLLAPPAPQEVFAGLWPGTIFAESGSAPGLVIASMVGTTVFSGLFIIRTTLVKEAGWTLADRRHQEKDAAVSAGLMFLLSAAIMAAAAGSLHGRGVTLSDPTQMMVLLEPLAGRAAAAIFVIGVIAAGLSSQFPNVVQLPWLLCDYRESSRDLRRTDFRVMVLAIALLGLVVPLLGARPVAVMLVSQAFGALLLPATVGSLAYLGNRRDLMGGHRFGKGDNLFLGLTFGFALFTCWLGLQGFARLLQQSLG